ncbi:MAG: tRNA pseudouridine synthase B [Chlamydiae bacterium]|nr:tRNA pseudouridine synthase B [Chlamydiota bacterium]
MTTSEGIILIDKPAGKTSFYLVNVLRKILGVKKIGHAGTLDPFATGVMVMLVGRKYTQMSQGFTKQGKSYLATIRLGVETDSYDCDGEVVSTSELIPSKEQVEEAMTHFQGMVQQTPPMFSAKKVGGRKLYELARKGQEIEREPITVTLETQLLRYEYPEIDVLIHCSKGTYVRSIAHDLGKMLGCGAHLSRLVRTQSGDFKLEECIKLEDLNRDNVHNYLKHANC